MEAINEKELWLLAVPIQARSTSLRMSCHSCFSFVQFNVEELNGVVVDLNASKDFEVKTGDDDKVGHRITAVRGYELRVTGHCVSILTCSSDQ